MKNPCVTNAGQKVQLTAMRPLAKRGDIVYFRVVRKAKGTYIKTYGRSVNIRVKWKAAKVAGWKPFSTTKLYKVR